MQTIKQGIKTYFENNQAELERWYPGLTASRLLEEYLAYYHGKFTYSQSPITSLGDLPFMIRENSPNNKGPSFATDALGQSIWGRINFFQQLRNGVPFAYMTGEAYFYNFSLWVDRTVLIPRKETEILVEMALQQISRWDGEGRQNITIADVGTGPGTIALALAINMPERISAKFSLIDLDQRALNLAKQNIERLRFMMKRYDWELLKGDRLGAAFNHRTFDLIVSNPPYIKRSNHHSVHEQVKVFEPELALYLEDCEYEQWFELFFSQIKQCLSINGQAFMEGSEYTLKELANLADTLGLSVEIKKDYTERDRFLILKHKNK